jgi:hypothetical protein
VWRYAHTSLSIVQLSCNFVVEKPLTLAEKVLPTRRRRVDNAGPNFGRNGSSSSRGFESRRSRQYFRLLLTLLGTREFLNDLSAFPGFDPFARIRGVALN